MATNWQDRVPTYANRYKITKSDGSTEYITLERADEPLVEGTPINAQNMNAIENAILTKMEKGAAVEMPTYVDSPFANFNDFFEESKTTIYTTVGDLDNAPNSTDEFVVITTGHGTGLGGQQLAMTIQHPVRMYARRYMNGEWYAWTEFYSKAYKPTPSEIGAAASSHTHDDRYFTESEMNAKLGTQVTYSLSGTTLTITTK